MDNYFFLKYKTKLNNVEIDTQKIYKMIFNYIIENNLYLVKCNNYIPNILKNYEGFNRGRNKAFKEAKYEYKPAACAVGSQSGFLEIYVVVSHIKPIEVSNPNQIESYNYPKEYGERPLFSRAVKCCDDFYISGTASIVGHETLHKNCLVSQFGETLNNIASLLSKTQYTFDDLTYNVYVKKASDLQVARDIFKFPATFYVTDICRDDLLIEIEGTTQGGYHIFPPKEVDNGI